MSALRLQQQPGSHGRAEVDFAVQDHVDGGEEVFGGGFFHDVAPGAGLQDSWRIEFLIVVRQDQDGQIRELPSQRMDQLKRLAVFELEVQQYQAGLLRGDRCGGIGDAANLTAGGQIGLAIDQANDSAANKGVVLHDENTRLLLPLGRCGAGDGGMRLAAWLARRRADRPSSQLGRVRIRRMSWVHALFDAQRRVSSIRANA
jgi:hypothetical protein